MKSKKQIPNLLPNEVLGQLKKMKTFPKNYLLKVLYWLLNRIDFHHIKINNVDYYIIPVLRNGNQQVPAPVVAVVPVSKRVCINEGMLMIDDGLIKKGFVLTSIIGMIKIEDMVELYFTDSPTCSNLVTIKELNQLLSMYDFFSPQNNSILNLAHIKCIDKGQKGYAHLTNNIKIELTRKLKPELLKLHKQYQYRH